MAGLSSMPFGKHRGKAFSALPIDYCRWALDTLDLRDELRGLLKAEVARRGDSQELEAPVLAERAPARTSAAGCPDPTLAREIVKAGHRALAQDLDDEARLAPVTRWLTKQIPGGGR